MIKKKIVNKNYSVLSLANILMFVSNSARYTSCFVFFFCNGIDVKKICVILGIRINH